MQSIIDKLQTPQSFAQSVQELVIALQRTNDPANLAGLRIHLKQLTNIDPTAESSPTWQELAASLEAVKQVVIGLVEFVQHHGNRKLQETNYVTHNSKYKISMCRDLAMRAICPRGTSCTFAHSEEELEKYRAKNRKLHAKSSTLIASSNNINTEPIDYLTDHSQYNYMSSSNEDVSPQRHNNSSEITTKLPLQSLPTMITTQFEHTLYQKPSTSITQQNSNLKGQNAISAMCKTTANSFHPNYESKSQRRSFNAQQNHSSYSVSQHLPPQPPPLPSIQR